MSRNSSECHSWADPSWAGEQEAFIRSKISAEIILAGWLHPFFTGGPVPRAQGDVRWPVPMLIINFNLFKSVDKNE